jgi:glucose-1-phosphate thymidylyltransferase
MDSLYEAGEFVRTVQQAQGLPIAVAEEIAYENGWIGRGQLLQAAAKYEKSPYGRHLMDVANNRFIINHND